MPKTRTREHTETHDLTAQERRAARVSGLAMLVMAVVAMPANAALMSLREGSGSWLGARGVAGAFLAVAVLDLFVAWSVATLLRRGAPELAFVQAALRTLVAVILGWAAVMLALDAEGRGDTGQAAALFQERWDLSLMFFGPTLLAIAAALFMTRRAPIWLCALVGSTGIAYLLDLFVPTVPSAVLLPFLMGELVLVAWLLWAGRPTSRLA